MADPHAGPAAAHPRLPLAELAGRVRVHRPVGAGGRGVEPLHVLPHHPAGQHLGPQVGEGAADHLDPAVRQAARSALLVEPRGDPPLQQVVERRGLQVVTPLRPGTGPVRGGDRPPEVALVPLVPPAVEDRQVEAAVERGLHAAGAARLQRPQRVVQPDVAARVELLRHAHAVVGQEDDPVPHPRVVGEPHQFLDQPLAALVGRMGLARDHQLHRPLRVEQQRAQPVVVAQHQGEPLVRGHPAGEADGQHVRVEDAVDPAELRVARAALAPGVAQPPPHLVDQLGAQRAAQLPDLVVGHVRDGVPALGAADAQRLLGPLLADAAGAHPEHLGRHPGRRVDAVGDGGDRHLLGVEARPESGEHLAADLAVQQRDAVGPLGQAQAHHRHVEDARVAARVGLRAQPQHPVDVDAGQLGVLPELPGDLVAVEPVDAGRDGGVGGEDRAGPHRLQRGVEVQPFADQFVDALQAEEAGVALVGVEHLGCGVAGELAVGAHRPDTSYAQEHLLQQPVLAAATVQTVGDAPFAGAVVLDVGVEQQQRHPADLGDPDPGPQRRAAGQGERDVGGGAVGPGERRERQLVRVEDRVVLLLPAVAGERLAEVSVPVEESHPDQRDTQVAGGLQVVAGQDAQAAGVLRQGRGDAELR